MDQHDDDLIPRLPVNSEQITYHDWKISYTKSHILKSVCINNDKCIENDPECCELCVYRFALDLPHLPDMVFPKNCLTVEHSNGAKMEFNPLNSLKNVSNGKLELKVACAEEWRESRQEENMEEKFKPFDWTFSTDYQGTLNDKFHLEETELTIDIKKLMRKERIIFYHDLTLFEDELHDNGIASLSVKIRVMPSGFFILLRYFLRVDNVMLRINDTRYYYEHGINYILKEFTSREAKVDELKHVPLPLFTIPSEIEKHLPIVKKTYEKATF